MYPPPVVQFDNGETIVVTLVEYKYEEQTVRIKNGDRNGNGGQIKAQDSNTLASRKQLPLLQAWALSMHMSQGLTIEKLCVQLVGGDGRDLLFAEGQGYVALSRGQSLQGLLVRGDVPTTFKTSNVVKRFYRYLEARRNNEARRTAGVPDDPNDYGSALDAEDEVYPMF